MHTNLSRNLAFHDPILRQGFHLRAAGPDDVGHGAVPAARRGVVEVLADPGWGAARALGRGGITGGSMRWLDATKVLVVLEKYAIGLTDDFLDVDGTPAKVLHRPILDQVVEDQERLNHELSQLWHRDGVQGHFHAQCELQLATRHLLSEPVEKSVSSLHPEGLAFLQDLPFDRRLRRRQSLNLYQSTRPEMSPAVAVLDRIPGAIVPNKFC